MGTPDPVAAIIAAAGTLDEAAYAKKHPRPVLLVSGTQQPGEASVRTTVRVAPRPGEMRPLLLTDAPPPTAKPQILLLASRGKGPFSDAISVGRGDANDLVLAHGTVSKFHAVFTETEAGWTLADQGSSNGTYVNGTRLRPQEPCKVGTNEILAFGQCNAVFMGPGALWRFLALQRRTA